jgi:hypothetical protein
MQAAMCATPEQAKWWRFRSSQNERAQLLLLTKFLLLMDSSHAFGTDHPIYMISAGEMRGFQLGNPNVPPFETHLDLFDKADRHLVLDVTGPKGHEQVLTQEEINAVVASIHSRTEH